MFIRTVTVPLLRPYPWTACHLTAPTFERKEICRFLSAPRSFRCRGIRIAGVAFSGLMLCGYISGTLVSCFGMFGFAVLGRFVRGIGRRGRGFAFMPIDLVVELVSHGFVLLKHLLEVLPLLFYLQLQLSLGLHKQCYQIAGCFKSIEDSVNHRNSITTLLLLNISMMTCAIYQSF